MPKYREANIYKWLARYTPTKQRNPVEDRLSAALGYLCGASPRFKKDFVEYIFAGEISRGDARRARVSMHPRYSLNVGPARETDIPDLLITDGGTVPQYAAFIESKWDAPVDRSQLVRYKNTLDANFGDLPQRELVLIHRLSDGVTSPYAFDFCRVLTWDRLFDDVFAAGQNDDLIKPFYDYCREDLVMGSFAGIPPFGEQNPYTTEKAKTILKQLDKHDRIRTVKRELGLHTVRDPRSEWMAWGFGKPGNVTGQPHLTLYVDRYKFGICVTIPDAFRRKRAFQKKAEEYITRSDDFTRGLFNVRTTVGKGAEYWVRAVYRHAWAGQQLVTDAQLNYKIEMVSETNYARKFENEKFRPNKEIARILSDALTARENNVEIQFEVRFYIDPESPEAKSRGVERPDVNRPEFVEAIVKAVVAQNGLLSKLSTFSP